MKRRILPMVSAALISSTMSYGQTVNASIDFTNGHAISPLIYGFNQDHEDPGSDKNMAARRLGGNRLSTFNWELNVENSGEGTNSNWGHIKGILGVNWNDRYIAGEAYRKFHQDNLDNGITSIVTVPIQGWVAADDKRTVAGGPHSADSLRWKKVEYVKGSPFSLTPDTTDRVVYLDESINFLMETFGDATTETGVKYISLGNEPGLWATTHELIQETPVGAEEYVQKVIAAAKAVKAVDPAVNVIAGEFAGINIYDLKSAPDWQSVGTGYDWFIDYFLDELKKASDQAGFRLVDILAIHNYPQHKVGTDGSFDKSGVVVKNSTSTEDYIRKTRMDFPRNMWDTTYIEPSWITDSKINGESHNILGRLQKSVDTYFPGTKLMLGEFDYGHDADISHGLALADLLGVFGNRGVEIATRWDLESGNEGVYTTSAYKLYRNYDGAKSTFGDSSLAVDYDSRDKASLWASVNSETENLHLICVNKDLSESTTFSVALNNAASGYSVNSVYGFDGTSSDITERTFEGTIENDTMTVTIPALSAYHIILQSDGEVVLQGNSYSSAKTIAVRSIAGGIILDGIDALTKVSLFTPAGRLVASTVTTTGVINQNISAGLYMIRIENERIGAVTSKIMVQ